MVEPGLPQVRSNHLWQRYAPEMIPIEIRLVHHNFRRLQRTLVVEQTKMQAGEPMGVSFDDGEYRYFITASKAVEDGEGMRQILYVDEQPLAAHPFTPSRVQPEMALFNTRWDGRWVQQGTAESGSATVSITLQGVVKGVLRNEGDGIHHSFEAELKSPIRFYAGDIRLADGAVLHHLLGDLRVGDEELIIEMRDIDENVQWRLDLTCSFRGAR